MNATMTLEDLYDSLSDDLKEKARACSSADELVDLVNKEGIQLTVDELDAVAGGVDWSLCSTRKATPES